jgi:acyl CoA:acetate/3-ketoacid CoA transferase beta subunit
MTVPKDFRYRYHRPVPTPPTITRVAVADGVGGDPEAVALALNVFDPGSIELLLGWVPVGQLLAELDQYAGVATLMGGFALRGLIDAGAVRYVSARLGTVPALLSGPLRAEVLVAPVAPVDDGFLLTTESAWVRAAIDAGAEVLGIERSGVPVLDAGPPIPPDRVRVVGGSSSAPTSVSWGEPQDVHRAVAERVASLIPDGARVQYGPGPVGTAVIDAVDRPVHIDTGMLSDAVMELDRRGLLVGRAYAPYSGGSQALYDWAPGRAVVDRIEHTHDPVRLGGQPPLIAVNTALEIDFDGQVNVEAVGGSTVAGIGGHPDYAFAAARSSTGLSVVALPTTRGPHRTLVERLSAPVSTPSHDVDVVVTESGVADLRGLDRSGRRAALAALWP